MHRFVSYIPAVIVAVIITVISSLYIDIKNECDGLNDTILSLKAELLKKNELLQESMKKVSMLQDPVSLHDGSDDRLSEINSDKIQAGNNLAPEVIPSPVITPQMNRNNISVNAKVSSIAKFVPLNENQRQRLIDKFTQELDPNQTETESLEDIIGKENADFYREQRKNTFEKVLLESIEKEILFVSRKLALEPLQEDNLRSLYLEVEKQIKNAREAARTENSAGLSTLEKLVLEEKERNKLLTEGAKNIFSPARYDQFIQLQAGNQDMQIWHE